MKNVKIWANLKPLFSYALTDKEKTAYVKRFKSFFVNSNFYGRKVVFGLVFWRWGQEREYHHYSRPVPYRFR